MNTKVFALACVATLLPGLPAVAHHSFAMFDSSKVVTMQGTVKELEWVNPHVWLHLMIPDNTGAMKEWAFEMNAVALQMAAGWRADSVKPGDKVTVEINPLKDGTRGGALLWATLPDGRRLGKTGAPNTPR